MAADPPLALTMGDACGIGPEIAAKAVLAGHAALVVGDAGVMRRAVRAVDAAARVETVAAAEAFAPAPGVVHVLAASDLPDDLTAGTIDARAGRAAHDAVIMAADLALGGRVRAVVTAPLAKASMARAGITMPGHTEILAERAGGVDVAMMLANDELRVVLVSIHVPLAEAIRRVTPESQRRAIGFADRGARAFGIARPRIAVAGLNPHAGEGGLFGTEDDTIIRPAVEAARVEGFDASGPHPPDTVFMRARRGEFDVVVAQYHDQGLIPVKYLGLDHGVNVTLGLPFVRTSVDHGTAFDIAGRGIADPASLIAAMRLARAMTAAR